MSLVHTQKASPFDDQQVLRRIREVMAHSKADLEERLQKIVTISATEMGADVCSVYLMRDGGMLELFATYGLDQRAVHVTRLSRGEGVVGHVAETAMALSLSSIANHPKFKLKPETGEQNITGGFAAVPIIREKNVLGVLIIQSAAKVRFTDAQVETLQILAMVIAEILVTLGAELTPDTSKALPASVTLKGITVHLGLAQGTAVIHEQKFNVPRMISDDSECEMQRFESALAALHLELTELLKTTEAQGITEHCSVLETFQMFAKDKGWLNKIKKAITNGFTAEAAAQKVLNDLRTRIHASNDFYMRERLWDFEDLTYRLVQQLQGGSNLSALENLGDIILVARTMGPADLLDYQKYKVKAVLLEEGMQTAHVAILARSLNIPIIGRIPDLVTRIQPGDYILVDGRDGKAVIRPSHHEIQAFEEVCLEQEKAQEVARNCLDLPAVTRDGVHVALYLNAGLVGDLDELPHTKAQGCGLYRTEIPFMMQKEFPDVDYQTKLYKELFARVGDKPLIFRTLDIGGDKVLPYFRRTIEENPMLGWRAIRIGLDRPMLLRKQARAMMRAAEGKILHMMFPMVSLIQEFLEARDIVESECRREAALGHVTPLEIKYGAMIEVPSLVLSLDALLPHVDFISVGTNDLFQFFFACDRGNPYIANHYDPLSPPFLTLLQEIYRKAEQSDCPISVCGEMASRPLEALALLGLGYRNLSMSAATLGKVKMMVRSLDLNQFSQYLESLLCLKAKTIRNELKGFSRDHQIII
jgi:phosphoenolpyruvate-protein phosphotransferase